jgi:hypothetical protein
VKIIDFQKNMLTFVVLLKAFFFQFLIFLDFGHKRSVATLCPKSKKIEFIAIAGGRGCGHCTLKIGHCTLNFLMPNVQ